MERPHDADEDFDQAPVVRVDPQMVMRFLELYPDLPLDVVIGAVRNAEATVQTQRPDRHAVLNRLIGSVLDAHTATSG